LNHLKHNNIMISFRKPCLQIILFVSICFIATNIAQSQNRDMQTWLTAEIKFPLNTFLYFGIENEIRFVENTSIFGRNQTELELYYLPETNWSFGLGYRFKTDFPFSEYSVRGHRWLADVMWKTRVERIRINTRFRIQNDQEAFLGEAVSGIMHREKIRFAYKIRKTPFLIYAGAETYFRIQDTTPFDLRKLRIFAGTRIDISKQTCVTVDLIRDKEYNRINPETVFIIQLGVSLDLGKMKTD
jgi:hypothetical protein